MSRPPENLARTAPKTIVLAWLVEDVEIVRAGRTDLGERPELRKILVPRAAVWCSQGTDEDERKARAYVKTGGAPEGAKVFVYPQVWQSGAVVDEPDPLGRAKADLAGGRSTR